MKTKLILIMDAYKKNPDIFINSPLKNMYDTLQLLKEYEVKFENEGNFENIEFNSYKCDNVLMRELQFLGINEIYVTECINLSYITITDWFEVINKFEWLINFGSLKSY